MNPLMSTDLHEIHLADIAIGTRILVHVVMSGRQIETVEQMRPVGTLGVVDVITRRGDGSQVLRRVRAHERVEWGKIL